MNEAVLQFDGYMTYRYGEGYKLLLPGDPVRYYLAKQPNFSAFYMSKQFYSAVVDTSSSHGDTVLSAHRALMGVNVAKWIIDTERTHETFLIAAWTQAYYFNVRHILEVVPLNSFPATPPLLTHVVHYDLLRRYLCKRPKSERSLEMLLAL